MSDDGLERLFAELATITVPVPPPAGVLARGRQRRRRARARAAFAAVGVAALAASATQLPVWHHSALPLSHVASTPSMCRAAPDGAVNSQLQQELNVGSQQDVWPIALSQNGQVLFVETTTQGFHGIAEESARTGAILATIAQLPPQLIHAQGALSPDGAIVWMNTYQGAGQVTGGVVAGGGAAARTSAVEMWSPRTGQTELEPAGQRTDALSAPVVSGTNHQLAAWEQADGARQEIVEADLATGVADVISRGYVGPPVFVGSALVWPVAPNAASAFVFGHDPQAPSRLVAVNAGTFPAHGQIPLPPALRAAGSASLIASNGTDVAYAASDQTELFYSSSPSEPARLVFRLHGFNTFSPSELAFGAGYLTWATDALGSYLASTTSLAVMMIPGFASVGAVGSGAVILNFTGPKTRQVTHLRVITESSISALECAAVK